MSKKRKRDGTEVDVDLVTIYDKLANENESVRLKAARQLLTKTFQSNNNVTEENIATILKRLFRGLCSSRKAARLGFVVALTEFLSQLQKSDLKSAFSPSQVVDALETCTEAEGGSRGQEERDFYFGRVFGAGAIIQSGILVADQDRTHWKRLLNLLCTVAVKKPWLRQECGWTLCQFVAAESEATSTLAPFIEDVIETLNAHKLIRTPEGVAIWLTAHQTLPESKLSKHVWKYSHPLAAKDIQNLADVMKNARTQQADAEFGAQGSTVWSASLHFAWSIILKHLFADPAQNGAANGSSRPKPGRENIEFSEFWKVVVDEGLFGAGSSNERKSWGIQLFATVAPSVPAVWLPQILQVNTLHCFVSATTSEDQYLRKSSHSALQQFEKRLTTEANLTQSENVAARCLEAILAASQSIDFDTATKTKVVATLLERGDQQSIWRTLQNLQATLRAQNEDQSQNGRLKSVINLEYKLLSACIRHLDAKDTDISTAASELALQMLKHGLKRVDSEQEDLQQQIKDRNAATLEQLIKSGSAGQKMFTEILSIQDLLTSVTDAAIRDTLESAAKRLRKLEKASKKADAGKQTSTGAKVSAVPLLDGYRLLFSLVAFDIYNGEQESIEIMQDLIEASQTNADLNNASTDPLVEILLSFSSRPSRFLRTLTPIIFEAISSGITSEGIQSLTRVLATPENAKGQQEMFEAADEDMVDGTSDSDSNNDDDDELDSDVEMINGDAASEANDDSDSESSSGSDSSDDNDENDEENDELAAFDAALASALGTKRSDSDSDRDSDEDMDDDEMLALDAKLTEVFKARKQATSKKRDAKDAKGNIVNFKNRVLDLIDVYIKHQYLQPPAIDLTLPLLRCMRTSPTKQITERAHKALKDLCTRCKGHQNVAHLEDSDSAFEIFTAIHDEACLETSNMHSAAASQTSILLVKVLIKSGAPISSIVGMYAQTNVKMLTDGKCKVQPGFFTEWNNWCHSARGYTAGLAGVKG